MTSRLAEIHQEYEQIISSNISDKDKDRQLAQLMTEMEKEFHIPALRNEQFEQANRTAIALYRKLSMSRVTI